MATQFPTGIDSATQLFTAVNGIATTLNGSLDNSAIAFTVIDTTNLPAVGYVVIDTEIIKYTAKTGTTLTGCTRGADGSAAASHLTGAAVNAYVVADHHNVLMNAIIAVETDISARLGIGASSNAIAVPAGVSVSIASTAGVKITNSLSVGSVNIKKRLTVVDASSSSTSVGSNPVLWISGGTGAINTLCEIGLTYGFTGAFIETYTPVTIGYQLTSGSGNTKGDIVFATRNVTTDTQPSEVMRITATGGVTISGAIAASAVLTTISNSDNTSTSSHAEIFLQAGGTSGGDPYIRFNVPATTNWAMGLANAQSDAFIISNGDQIGTGTNVFVITKATLGVGIHGTNTNDNATAGFVGEYFSGNVSSFTNFPTTGQYGDLTNITLTAGDWDISVNFEAIANGATVTDIRCGIGTATGNSSTGLIEGDNTAYGPPPTSVITQSLSIPPYRVSISGSTTYYLKYRAGYSVATPQAVGRISARRVR